MVWSQFSSGAEHLKLAVVLFQNLFPPINVQTVKLGACQVHALPSRPIKQHTLMCYAVNAISCARFALVSNR